MEQKPKKEVKLLLTITSICIYFFLYNRDHFAFLIYTVLAIIVWIFFNRKRIQKNISNFNIECKRLKNLEYYHITDCEKLIDLEKRKNTYSLFGGLTWGTSIIILFILLPFISFFNYIGDHNIFKVLIFFFCFLVIIIGYGGLFAGAIYRFTTLFYVVTPICFAIIYLVLIGPLFLSLPSFVRFMSYILITSLLYYALTCFLPVHVVRRLNSKTILISSFLVIITAFVIQIISFYVSYFIEAQNLIFTIDYFNNKPGDSEVLKNIIIDNPELFDIINYFIEKEAINQLTSIANLGMTALTISYIVSAMPPGMAAQTKDENKKACKIL